MDSLCKLFLLPTVIQRIWVHKYYPKQTFLTVAFISTNGQKTDITKSIKLFTSITASLMYFLKITSLCVTPNALNTIYLSIYLRFFFLLSLSAGLTRVRQKVTEWFSLQYIYTPQVGFFITQLFIGLTLLTALL